MTNRDFYNAIAEGQVTDEIKAFAAEKIATLNADAEKRKAKVSEENTAFYAELGEKIINSVEVGKLLSTERTVICSGTMYKCSFTSSYRGESFAINSIDLT